MGIRKAIKVWLVRNLPTYQIGIVNMRNSRNLVLLSVAMIATVWAIAEIRIQASAKFGGVGPDVIVGDLPGTTNWGQDNGMRAYSVGTTSCNIGDQQLTWIANSDQHPVISQNLYRIKDGRIEQLGQSWLKHGFFALSQSLCGSCQPTNGSALGIGCSDPYSSNLNGQQGNLVGGTGGLGPKSEVNATTGEFAWPCRRLTSSQRGTLGGRIQVPIVDLTPANNSGATYYVESQYVQPEDAEFGNDLNNASYRRVFVSGGNLNLNTSTNFPTVRQKPAIYAWQAEIPEVQLFDVDIPDDGRVIVGVHTTQTNSGYHTEIAVLNHNSHQSVRSVAVDCCAGTLSAPGFNDADYHAEPYMDSDWAPSINGSVIEWGTDTFQQDENANALRWGTMYSFWFDSEFEPAEIVLGLFRPGAVSEMVVEIGGTNVLLGDINLDGAVNLLDVSPFVALIGSSAFQKEGDINGDGEVNLLDVDGFIALLSN